MRRFGVLILFVATMASAQAPMTLTGVLDGKLHVDTDALALTMFDAGTPDDAKRLGVALGEGDRIYTGTLGLPKRGVVTFAAAIVRSADGTDLLYVDEARNGAMVRLPFRDLKPGEGDARLKGVARFEVSLPPGPFASCPMEVEIPKDMGGAPKLPVPYTSLAYVQGTVQLPGRAMLMRFEYDFATKTVDLEHGLEMADVNGDGRIDQTPGGKEFLRSQGSAPVFRVDRLTLQAERVELNRNEFVVRSVAAAGYQRIDLSVGSVVPDFVFTDMRGVKRHLSDVKGKFRLLDFWATWCQPCMHDLPLQKKVYEQFHRSGFEILGMNGDDEPEKAAAVLQRLGAAWPQARKDDELYEKHFQIAQWPTLILIDERGKIVSRGEKALLPLDGENLAKTLKSLLGQ